MICRVIRSRISRKAPAAWRTSLAPTSGFLATGPHYISDRYAYWPHIGLYWIAGWFLAVALEKPSPRLRALAAAALVVALGWKTTVQLEVWRDANSLYRHAIAVDGRNEIPHYKLGGRYFEAGQFEDALAAFREAARHRPGSYRAHLGAGLAEQRLGGCERALPSFERAVAAYAEASDAWTALAVCLEVTGRPARALEAHRTAVRAGSCW